MKDRLVSHVRSLFISPEFVLLVVAVLIIIYRSSWVNTVSTRIDTSTDYFKAALLAPFGIGYWTLQTVNEVLFPAKDKKEVLQKHPDYYNIRVVCNMALFYAILFIILGVAAALKMTPAIPGLPNFLLLVAVLGAFIVGLTCYFARLKINEIFCECAKNE